MNFVPTCLLYVEFSDAEVVYPAEIGLMAQNSEQPIRLPNGLLYPRLEVEQLTHSGDEIVFYYLFLLAIIDFE